MLLILLTITAHFAFKAECTIWLEGVQDNLIRGYNLKNYDDWNKASTNPIFRNDETKSVMVTLSSTAHAEERLVPTWFNVDSNSECKMDHSSTETIISNAQSYYEGKASGRKFGFDQKTTLTVEAKEGPVSGKASTDIENAAMFGSESTSQFYRAKSKSSKTKAMNARMVKTMYTIAMNQDPSYSMLSAEFLDAAKVLDNSDGTRNDFEVFIDKYGTHYIDKAEMGGVATMTFVFSNTYSSEQIKSATSQESSQFFSRLFFSYSQSSGETTNFGSSTSSFVSAASSATDIRGGGENAHSFDEWCVAERRNPFPVKIRLKPITYLLQLAGVKTIYLQTLWQYITEMVTKAVISHEGYCYLTGCQYSYEDCVGGECKKSDLPDVTFYRDTHMSGDYMHCAIGTDTPNLKSTPNGCIGYVGGNSISSVTVPKGAMVYVYQSESYKNDEDGLCTDNFRLSERFGHDDLDSFKAYPFFEGADTYGCVKICKDAYMKGTCATSCGTSVNVSSMNSGPFQSIGKNAADGIQFPQGWIVEMYSYPNYDRNNRWYYLCENKTRLSNYVGNDSIDSFKIRDVRRTSKVNTDFTFPMPNPTSVTHDFRESSFNTNFFETDDSNEFGKEKTNVVMQDNNDINNDNVNQSNDNSSVDFYVLFVICVIFFVFACLFWKKRKNIVFCRKGYTKLHDTKQTQSQNDSNVNMA